MSLSVWYHCYADGAWGLPVREFLEALGDPSVKIHLGVVGTPEHRQHAIDYITGRTVSVEVVAEADKGFEQVTLVQLQKAVKRASGHFLYAHTKGAVDLSDHRARWRQSMTDLIVRDRKICTSMIYTRGLDAVGCHWLVPEQWQGMVTTPMFGGNFWIATARYLRRLGPVKMDHRHRAEEWVGSGIPRPAVWDRKPGWPHDELFGVKVGATA